MQTDLEHEIFELRKENRLLREEAKNDGGAEGIRL